MITTQILEATIVKEGKTHPIINTLMNVYIDWDVTLVKSKCEAKIQYDFKRVYGNVTLMLRENFFSFEQASNLLCEWELLKTDLPSYWIIQILC